MRNGYYLSTYLHIDSLANFCGAPLRHDQNMSLWRLLDDKLDLVHYWELERITGMKRHSRSLFSREEAVTLVASLLEEHGLQLEDMVAIWGTPHLATANCSVNEEAAQLSYHSIAHLFSTLLTDTDVFFGEDILGLAVDAGPDSVVDQNAFKAWYCGCYSHQGNIRVFPVESPGCLWMWAKHRFGMEEGSLMALASASMSTSYLPTEDAHCIDWESPSLADAVLTTLTSRIESLSRSDIGVLFNGYDPRFTERENIISMVMKHVQMMSINIMERDIDAILKKFDADPRSTHLALSGGYALNCPTNTHLMSKYGFRSLMSPPVVNDSGQSLGIALYEFYKATSGTKFRFKLQSPYKGDGDDDLMRSLLGEEFAPFINDIRDIDYDRLVYDVQKEPIVWFDGKAEMGPRALGNRSILGDPRTTSTKERLNEIKIRQWWRPVAPIILEGDVGGWFVEGRSSPYMLEAFHIREDRLPEIPAVAHLDGTARVQTVNAEQNLGLYNVLAHFKHITGVPLLCNTSLNDRGEPIVNTVEEALNFCLRKKIHSAYIGGKRVELANFARYSSQVPRPRKWSTLAEQEVDGNVAKILNPYGFSREDLYLYLSLPELRLRYDITRERDARAVEKAVKLLASKGGAYSRAAVLAMMRG